MMRHCWRRLLRLTALVSLAACVSPTDAGQPHDKRAPQRVDAHGYDIDSPQIDPDAPDHHLLFQTFVSRPDIDAPRFEVKVYDEAALAPGFWFLAPYQSTQQQQRGGEWVGPHIYDGKGELIWSGVPDFKGFDAFDFKTVNVSGEPVLSLIYRHQEAVLLDSSYRERVKLHIADDHADINMHDFNVLDGGKTALLLKASTRSSYEDISLDVDYRGDCNVYYYGFEEVDTTTSESVFSWFSQGHIGLNETYVGREKPDVKCRSQAWDYIHINSVDKFPDGDFLVSARNCNAMYKISAKDGSVVWKFGGINSDFRFEETFQGQHDARVRSQNDTHTVISFLDNSYIPNALQVYINDYSRAFLVALRTDVTPMTATTLQKHDHPHGEYSRGRGSYQILPNGNDFIGWTTNSLHTEYSPDGALLMEASLRAPLKTYRSYKGTWTGHPVQPPDVYAESRTYEGDDALTSIWVSWNGATEVKGWNFHLTTPDGKTSEPLGSMERSSFETQYIHHGFASHVYAEALDWNGTVLGRSGIFRTIPPADFTNAAVLSEADHIQSLITGKFYDPIKPTSPAWAFMYGMFFCILSGLFIWAVVAIRRRWPRKQPRTGREEILYDSLDGEKMIDEPFMEDDEDGEAEEFEMDGITTPNTHTDGDR